MSRVAIPIPKCCDRVFPDPDPMMRFIDEDEGPGSFWNLPHNDRSRRARMYLLATASGEHPMMAWLAVLSTDPEHAELLHEIVDVINADDSRIEEQIRQKRRWMATP